MTSGPLAHFKYFTNYLLYLIISLPNYSYRNNSRILGFERDSYYEDFGIDKCHVAVKVKEPTRSIQRAVNYLIVLKGLGGLNGSAGHTQIPLEIILPRDINNDKLCFRIYFWHEDEDIMSELLIRLTNKSFVYPISLGISEFLGNVENVQVHEDIEKKGSADYVNILTVCNLNTIKDRGLNITVDNETRQYIKEIMPIYFTANRKDMLPGEFIYERNGKGINAKLKGSYLKIKNNSAVENIVFMEG